MRSQYQPNRVIQIISGSRSGSTFLKTLLATSPDVMSLDGEEEPYIEMTGNGFGLTSTSDAIETLENPALFRSLIYDELFGDDWVEHRLKMQYRGKELAEMLNDCASTEIYDIDKWLGQWGVIGHYDGCPPEERVPFSNMVYEMPPYVKPTMPYDYDTSCLLLKSPYNSYRPTAMKEAFPESEFTEIVLVRNPGATINGLIDGWNANYGFHKHLTARGGWWKFDAPPGWEHYTTAPIADRALFQWVSSYTSILKHWPNAYVVRFEDLLTNPDDTLYKLSKALGIEIDVPKELPVTMATEAPKPGRWRARIELIERLLVGSKEACSLIKQLDYGDSTTWL